MAFRATIGRVIKENLTSNETWIADITDKYAAELSWLI